MPLTLNEIFQATKSHYHLSLLEGEGGLHNIMNWVYISEDSTTHEFLKGGELIITTGINCTTEDSLFEFVSAMIESHTCGIILNTGKYIHLKNITDRIKDLCAKNNYPLLVMPWQVHIYDITRDYYNRIFLDNQLDTSITNAFLSYIREDDDRNQAKLILDDHGFPSHGNYFICLLYCSDGEIPDDLRQQLFFQIESFLKAKSINLHTAFYKNFFLFICYNNAMDLIHSIMHQLLNHLKKYYGQLNFRIGIGSIVPQLSDLSISYQRAMAAYVMAKNHKTSIFSFDDMGFFRLLHSVNDKTLLKKYQDEYLAEIIEYDNTHNTNYLDTLYYYLHRNGSIQLIAADMFCHRNTVSYRIHVIKDLWNYDLDDIELRFHLMSAFQIKEYLELISL